MWVEYLRFGGVGLSLEEVKDMLAPVCGVVGLYFMSKGRVEVAWSRMLCGGLCRMPGLSGVVCGGD